MEDIELYEKWCEYNLNNSPISFAEFCYEQGRADERSRVIEEFVNALEKHQQDNWIDNLEYGITFDDIEEVAEQLKEQNNDN